jgi:hypothetical protein
MLFSMWVCGAQDLSTYRDFGFGATADEIGSHIVIHQRPVLIEDFEWRQAEEIVAIAAPCTRSPLPFTTMKC